VETPPPYAFAEAVAPGIARLLARNPSPFTYTGTQTYLVGRGDDRVVIDPGPDQDDHLAAILDALGGKRLAAIACTHTHRDHSPAARRLKEATGAPIVGCAALALESVGPRADASFDFDYAPDRVLVDGEAIRFGEGEALTAIATPGHTVGHMSYLVASGGQQLFIQSDVTGIHQLFVRNPGWFSMFDADGPKAEATRRAFFDRVIAEKGMIAGYHFGFPNVGTLSKDGNGYAFAAVKA